MKPKIDQSGLLVESDFIALSTTMHFDGNFIYDHVTSAQHQVISNAKPLISDLEKGQTYREWAIHAHKLGISFENQMEILFFLNSMGGLQVTRTLNGNIKRLHHVVLLMAIGIKPQTLSYRYPVQITKLFIAVGKSMSALTLAVAAFIFLAYGTNHSLISVSLSGLFFLTIILLTTVVHELTHAIIIGRYSKTIAILRRGLRIGILHKPQPYKIEILSALAGPAAGMFTAIMLGNILQIWAGHTFSTIGWLVAAFHVLSWLPWYGDGEVFNRYGEIKSIKESE